MRFLRRTTPSPVGADTEVAEPVQEPGRTAAKGRPTPKRRDAQRRRGPLPPPPRTQREAAKYAKATRPDKTERRRRAAERREGIAAGDDKYLPPRDQGPVRAYVRDLVDSRRHLAGLFMPLAGVVFLSILLPNREIQTYVSIVAMSFMAGIVVEAIVLGRQIAARVRAKFPNEQVKGFGVGWYAFSRASQPRKLRVPKPRVQRGAAV